MKDSIKAENLTAQLSYRAEGNPPNSLPESAISNSFPGLEMDFRNVWKKILVGIELHEASNFVVSVEDYMPEEVLELRNNYQLLKVAEIPVTATIMGPKTVGGPDEPLPKSGEDSRLALEWSNALAGVLHREAGQSVECEFASLDPPIKTVKCHLRVRPFFDTTELNGQQVRRPAIARDIAEPGALTQSLCSPWQNDYRECACFYWAASRPDYVNVEVRADGVSAGNSWMEKDRQPDSPPVYIVDDRLDERLVSYNDLFQDWEHELRFVFGNQDEPPVAEAEEPPSHSDTAGADTAHADTD